MAIRPTLSFRFNDGPLETLELDAVLSEKHDLASDVTEHPVERGAAVSDHSRPKQEQLSIEALVSNHQLHLPSSQQEPRGTRVPRVAALIRRLQETGTLVRYQSERGALDDAIITAFGYTLDHTGESLRFSLSLKSIRFVETRTVAIRKRRAQPKGDPLKDEGPKATEPTDKPYESLLFSGGNALTGGWLSSLNGRQAAAKAAAVSGGG